MEFYEKAANFKQLLLLVDFLTNRLEMQDFFSNPYTGFS